ncbi:MAG: response regulator, partial [Alphaproteobacteria bacterium]
ATADISVVAVTAHAMKGSEEYFIEMGCVDYISKPIDIHRFRGLIDKYLGDYPF